MEINQAAFNIGEMEKSGFLIFAMSELIPTLL